MGTFVLKPLYEKLPFSMRLAITALLLSVFSASLVSASPVTPSHLSKSHQRHACPDGSQPKRRIIPMTDIVGPNNEPDDMQSFIHLLATADLFQIDAIITTTGWNSDAPETWRIFEIIDAYEKDLPNLMKRNGQVSFLDDETIQCIGYWPSPDYLRSIVTEGQPVRGFVGVGDSLTTNGSALITEIADRDDHYGRPIYVSAWGSGNTVAQALWDVRATRSGEEVRDFVSKLRLYTITDQDVPNFFSNDGPGPTVETLQGSSHIWIRQNFPDLFFIWSDVAWRSLGGLTVDNWDEYNTSIQGQGALGSLYPTYVYTVEGDTVSWLFSYPGISDSEDPSQISFGGYFVESFTPDNKTWAYYDGYEPASNRSRAATALIAEDERNDFIARMAWVADGSGNRSPDLVLEGAKGYEVIYKSVKPGETIFLSAAGSSDPDGDRVALEWIQDTGVTGGGWHQPAEVNGAHSEQLSVKVPYQALGYDIHFLLHGVDDGTPALGSWRRIVLRVGHGAPRKPGYWA